jgi:hypothetical protein
MFLNTGPGKLCTAGWVSRAFPCVEGNGGAVNGACIRQGDRMENHPANVQVQEVLASEGSTEFFHEKQVVRPSKEQFTLGIPEFDFEATGKIPDCSDPSIRGETLVFGKVVVSEPSW